MSAKPSVFTLSAQCAEWVNTQKIPAFYAGIRAQCAQSLGIAPNNAAFNAAFDAMETWQNAAGELRAVGMGHWD